MADDEAQYWYNSRTGEVEKGMQSNSLDRVGPFASRADAENAPQKLQENSRKWAAEDAADDSWKR